MERKEAIEIVRKLYNESLFMKKDKEAMVTLIPELKESEDERIRREMIEIIKNEAHEFPSSVIANKSNSWIAWLEKQGEQKPVDEVEPKFKVGDWIFYSGDHCEGVRRITKINENGYYIERNGLPHGIIPFNHEIFMRLWTIQDAKKGDVLYCKKRHIDNSEIIMMYSGINIRNHVDSYCRYSPELGFNAYITNVLDVEHDFIIPATKEQCDLLLSKMKEAGYEWDAEKKELNKIE